MTDKEALEKLVHTIQEVKDSHNENGTPINYGTICDLVIIARRLLDEINSCANINENVERVRLKPIEDRGGYLSERGDEPTVLFKGVPLCYAENGFVNTYCRN